MVPARVFEAGVAPCPNDPCPWCFAGVCHRVSKEELLEYANTMVRWAAAESSRFSSEYDMRLRAITDVLYELGINTAYLPKLEIYTNLCYSDQEVGPERVREARA